MIRWIALTMIATAVAAVWIPAGFTDYPNIRLNNDLTSEIQNEQQIIANPLNPDNIVAVWRDFRLGYRQVGIGTSFDGGYTWTQQLLQDPNYIWQSDPGVTVDSQGNFYVVFLSYESTSLPNGLYIQKSTDGGLTWGASVEVVNGVPNVFEDKELMACDRTGSPYDGNLYVVWARFYDITIMCSRSVNGGQSFESPLTLGGGYCQWPLAAVGPNGEVYVAWVSSPGGLRVCRSDDGGATFTSHVPIDTGATMLADLINGGITVFSYPAMDVDISDGPYSGRVHVAYMDDTASNGTDMFYKYSDDGGVTWSTRVRLNDDPTGVAIDQFHPWLAANPDTGEVAVMFYDRRLDPGNLWMDVYWTHSSDGGATWSPNERITTVSSDPTAGSDFLRDRLSKIGDRILKKDPGDRLRDELRDRFSNRAGLIGEYNGMCASGTGWNMVWTDTRGGDQDTYTAPLDFEQPCINDGDVNLDGEITAGDAQLAFLIALGSYTPSFEEACAADCNGDEEITAGDAQLIFLTALGSGSCADPL